MRIIGQFAIGDPDRFVWLRGLLRTWRSVDTGALEAFYGGPGAGRKHGTRRQSHDESTIRTCSC